LIAMSSISPPMVREITLLLGEQCAIRMFTFYSSIVSLGSFKINYPFHTSRPAELSLLFWILLIFL
jgi:hypothetical protein